MRKVDNGEKRKEKKEKKRKEKRKKKRKKERKKKKVRLEQIQSPNKRCSIAPSRVVPHRSTTATRPCLTSLFGWEAVSQGDMAASGREAVK